VESFGPILWDFVSRTMGFVHNSHHVFWTATPMTPELAALMPPLPDLLEDLLLQFGSIFEASIGMPPERERIHCIRLLPHMTPIAVRPYRYAHFQKP
jgi:hypothetical protein